MAQEAVIYCRVSSERQAKEGDGIRSQEQRCRSYADTHEYRVTRVFADDGVSGAITDRPAILAMLGYLSAQAQTVVVIIDDISRIARDVRAHGELRAAIRVAGGRLESPSLRFEETASGEFVEYIMAAAAQYGRKGNREQVLNRMRARLEQGYWTFPAPPGYHYEKHPFHKKVIVPSREAKTVLAPALEAFARGRLLTQREVARYLQAQGFYRGEGFGRHAAHITVLEKRVARIFETLPLYAGYLEYKPWDIGRVPAKHESVITPAVFGLILERLGQKERPLAVARADSDDQFILRNFVRCAGCGRPLTGSLAKGQYPRYQCYWQQCAIYGRSYSAVKVEPAFHKLLEHLTPSPSFIEAISISSQDEWARYIGEWETQAVMATRKIQRYEEQLRLLVHRLVSVSDTVVPYVEAEIESLEEIIKKTKLEAAKYLEKAPDYGAAWRRVITYFSEPAKAWKNGSAKDKRIIHRMVFKTPPVFDREKGLITYDLTLPYRVSQDFRHTKEKVVDLTGKSYHLNIDGAKDQSWFDTIIEWGHQIP